MLMKTFLAPPQRKLLTRSKAWACALLNLLAFPSMGTVMAGRRSSGYVQAALMLAGFFLTMGFMLWYFMNMIRLITHSDASEAHFKELYHQYAWIGLLGLGLCLLSWFWALASSIAIVRTASSSPS